MLADGERGVRGVRGRDDRLHTLGTGDLHQTRAPRTARRAPHKRRRTAHPAAPGDDEYRAVTPLVPGAVAPRQSG